MHIFIWKLINIVCHIYELIYLDLISKCSEFLGTFGDIDKNQNGHYKDYIHGAAAYQLGNTSSRTITEVKLG